MTSEYVFVVFVHSYTRRVPNLFRIAVVWRAILLRMPSFHVHDEDVSSGTGSVSIVAPRSAAFVLRSLVY